MDVPVTVFAESPILPPSEQTHDEVFSYGFSRGVQRLLTAIHKKIFAGPSPIGFVPTRMLTRNEPEKDQRLGTDARSDE
jgi:hypothetical protein